MVERYPTTMEDKNAFYLIDTHAHLNSSRFGGSVTELLVKARESNVGRILSIACDIEDSEANIALSENFEEVIPTVGVHPLYVHEVDTATWLESLRTLAGRPEVAAIGEIGLDYFHPPQDGSTEEAWRKTQRDVFEAQLQLAIDFDLPVVIHQRESADDVMEVLRQFPGTRAVLHCFNGTRKQAEIALEAGFYLSFTGILTFPSAGDVREVAAAAPLDRIMVETDSPYLAPVPFRGKQCEPHMVAHTARQLGELHGLSLPDITKITTENAFRFFRM